MVEKQFIDQMCQKGNIRLPKHFAQVLVRVHGKEKNKESRCIMILNLLRHEKLNCIKAPKIAVNQVKCVSPT